ncbi:MAG: glycosyltransferase family 4 protein [Acidimicrobiales bacterium]
MTIIYELARAHKARGGETSVVVSAGTRHDYDVGRCIEVGSRGRLPSRPAAALDALAGRFGLPRLATAARFKASCDAVEDGFAGAVFVHNAPAALPYLAAGHPSAMTCLYAHNDLFRTYSPREMRRMLRPAHRVICVSEFIADRLVHRAGVRLPSVKPVLNGVDTEMFRPADRPLGEPPGDPEAPLVLFVGRVKPEKGPDLLIRAAVRLRDRCQFRLRIVGSSGFSASDPLTEYERQLRRLATPLRDRVEFLPFVGRREVVEQYRSASLLCLPSNWDEPCGLTVLEGLACGLPMVVARRGGIPEVGQEAVEYFSPPDLGGLTDRLEWLLHDEAARTSLAARARARAEQLSWARQYEALVEALDH